jgi:hypothetical protein
MNRNAGPARRTLLVLVAVLLAGVVVGAFAQSAPPAGPPPVNGTIVSVNGNIIRLALADKSQKDVAIQPTTLVLERDTAAVGDIQAGDAMGVAARRSGSDLIATSINIFSKEMWNGAMKKGQWPMTSGETMTNAVVTSYVVGMSGHTLVMKYNDVMATITVPDGVPIHRLVTMKPGALAAGMMVSVRGSDGSDGTLKAAAISFEGPARS